MHEGTFRILKALGGGATMSARELARSSCEAVSVVDDVLQRYPKWFQSIDDRIHCTETGFAALARELVAREASARSDDGVSDDVARAWRELAARRQAPKRELDQVFALEESVFRRAAMLIEAGELQRGLVFLGDDDFSSVAVSLLGSPDRPVTVIDVDESLLTILSEEAASRGWDLRTHLHDLRAPLPKKLRGRFGCVFTDPPYAIEGFSLFVSRAIELLKPDGRLYVCFGHSRRAPERGLAKQEALTKMGLLVERVVENFTRYDGAESIGASSALWVCAKTPQTKPAVRGEASGPLYTSRPNTTPPKTSR